VEEMKQFSVEEIKRLVPEVTYISRAWHGWSISVNNEEEVYNTDELPWSMLLTTRAQLEVAVECLKEIEEGAGPVEPMAEDALDKIKELEAV
jgi:hypothetical protein